MSKPEVWLTAIAGLWFLLSLSLHGGPSWYWLLGLAVMQGCMIGIWLIIRRQQEFSEVGIGGVGSSDPKRKLERIFALRVIGALIILMPFVVMPNRQGFVDTTFAWAQLRKESAVVHIKAPWTEVVEQGGLRGQKSFRGPEYKRYSGVTVLLRSLGDSVVLSIPTGIPHPGTVKPGTVTVVEPDQFKKVSIPASDIWIE